MSRMASWGLVPSLVRLLAGIFLQQQMCEGSFLLPQEQRGLAIRLIGWKRLWYFANAKISVSSSGCIEVVEYWVR